jgi:regulator of replication initiation timing
MSELTEIVDSLENRISKLLHKYEALKHSYHTVQEELTICKQENSRLQVDLENSLGRVQTLKAVNAMLGSNDYKKDTKLKINSLIREIDHCIVQLSE